MTSEPAAASAHGPAAEPGAPTRRHLLAGAAAVGAVGSVGLLAGCGSDDGGTDDPGVPTGQESRPSGRITSTSEVPVGSGQVVVLENAKVVVTQPAAGDFKAFSAICTHAGCTVAGVSGNRITCPCHGSAYDAATGQVVVGANNADPSTQAPLAPVEITVTGDTVSFA